MSYGLFLIQFTTCGRAISHLMAAGLFLKLQVQPVLFRPSMLFPQAEGLSFESQTATIGTISRVGRPMERSSTLFPTAAAAFITSSESISTRQEKSWASPFR